MARSKSTLNGQAFSRVLRFSAQHWKKQPLRIAGIGAMIFISTIADVMTPLYAGHLVEAVATGAASDVIAWNAAITAFLVLLALGLAALITRQFAWMGMITVTLKMMGDITVRCLRRRTALFDRLARQRLRWLDRAQGDARHLGARHSQRHSADRHAALAGDAGRHLVLLGIIWPLMGVDHRASAR